MANEQLQIQVGATIKELKKALKKAEGELKGFSKSTEDGLKGARVSASNLRGGVAGVGEEFIKVGKAAKVGGAAMKAAMISTGIGALVVGLGLVVENWDKIGRALGFINDEYEKQIANNKRVLSNLNHELKVNKLLEKISIAKGELTTDEISERKKILKQQQLAVSQQIVALNNQLQYVKSKALELTLLEKAAIASGLISAVTLISEDEAKDIKEADDALKKMQLTALNLQKQFVELNKETTKKPKLDDKVFSWYNQLSKTILTTKELLAKNPPTIPTQPILESFGVIGNGIKKLKADYGNALTDIEIKNQNLKDSFLNLVESLRAVAQAGIGESIGNMASGLGEALAGSKNVIDALGQSLLSSLGSLLVQFGKLTLAYGVANLALFKAMTSGPNPISAGAAIAAGAALIAVGSAIKSFTANTQSSLGGGYSGGGGTSSNNYSSTTTSGGGGFQGGRVVFEIAGNKLIGVLNNTSLGNLRVGDSDQLITTG